MAFLDEWGLAHFWNKIKAYVDGKVGSASGGGQDSSPIGTIISWLGHSAPDDYLPCDGTAYNITEYKALADFIETEFGTANYFGGDGTTTFAVPDMTGRFLLGSSADNEIAETGGSEEVTLTEAQMPKHYHSIKWNTQSTAQSGTNKDIAEVTVGGSTRQTTEVGGSAPHPNMPPYFTVLICIKAK